MRGDRLSESPSGVTVTGPGGVRTVSSRLGRIRDKIGCRRRADLTSLALRAGLI